MYSDKQILVTNDDGICGEGLITLVKELYKVSKNLIIIAPKENQSAVSQKITLDRGLSLEKIAPLYANIPTYTVDGTPSDCVKIALSYLDLKIDLVVSGMNNGLNVASDILYSGTLAACFEANLNNVKALGFSCERKEFKASESITRVFDYIYENKLLDQYNLLNVNIPLNPKGIKMTVQGKRPYVPYYDLIDGLIYARRIINDRNIHQEENADILAYFDGYISISPLTINRTEKIE